MKNMPISKAKEIREELGLTHIVIFGVDEDGNQYVATHGLSDQNAREAAIAGNKLKTALGWPENLCKDKPLARVHKNCAFYKQDFGMHCFNGWTGDGREGYCLAFPDSRKKYDGEEHGCIYFQPV